MNSIIEQIQELHTRIQDTQKMPRCLIVTGMDNTQTIDLRRLIQAEYESRLARLEHQFEAEINQYAQ